MLIVSLHRLWMTRTLEMFSCRLAFTRASARRTTWKARREWVRQYAVTISTSGTTTLVSSAR